MKTSVCTFCQSSTMPFLSACYRGTEKTLEAQNHVRNPSSNLLPLHACSCSHHPLPPPPSCGLIKGVNDLQEVENQKQTLKSCQMTKQLSWIHNSQTSVRIAEAEVTTNSHMLLLSVYQVEIKYRKLMGVRSRFYMDTS